MDEKGTEAVSAGYLGRVEWRVAIHQIDEDRIFSLQGRLIYDRVDPFAVNLEFYYEGKLITSWIMSRESLQDGLQGSCGIGDVRLIPYRYGGIDLLQITLLPAYDLRSAFLLSASTVEAFLQQTLHLVPGGTEASLIDWDALLARLFADGECG
ncbi:SsgA family sporulation/cell division regulator [Streptomyces sp. NPDC086783]|uniref:SsgA family sporulation/cell division regulator n=1 Tax=Streptomyces sp. NPDC086783 TaxID=3365758 RepID=UPI00380377D8